MPLLIGGATTSRVHTAVKISPNYEKGQAIYVSMRAARSASSRTCCRRPSARNYIGEIRAEYVKVREAHLRNEATKRRITLAAARANKFSIDWTSYTPPKPSFLGTRAFTDYPLAELVPYIDWTPFFQTWELTGRYPAILKDNKVGAEAKKLFDDAQDMLKRMVAEKWLTATGVIGFWPANSVGDDIELFTDDTRNAQLATLHTLRQQIARDPSRDRAHTALADFVAPKETGLADYVGGFAVTTGIGEEEALDKHIKETDDYSRIICKALCDRLAEAFAERMHARVRREFWGYAAGETLSNDDLIAEKYRGIRPAPGYPAQPDHTEKATLWKLMDVDKAPASSSPRATPCGRARPCRASIFRIPTATTSASARSSATRSRTTPGARAGRSRRRSAGWRRCSTTIRARCVRRPPELSMAGNGKGAEGSPRLIDF